MKRYVIIALIVGICRVNSVVSLIATTTINYVLPRIVLHYFFENDTQLSTLPQVYGPCLGQLSGNDSFCSLTLSARRPTPRLSFTCDFKVSLPTDSALKCDIVQSRGATIAGDKALLILTHGCVHKWYVLHFSNCTAMPIEHENQKSIRACTWGFFLQVPRENNAKSSRKRLFDVLLDGPNRVTLGRLIPFDEDQYHYPMLPHSNHEGNAFLFTPTKGRVFIVLDAVWRQKEWGLKVLTAGDDGLNRTLKEYKFPNLYKVYSSAMREMLTVCVGFNETAMTCAQFDSDGDTKFEIHLPYMDWIYNLAGGGFNAIFIKCVDDYFTDYLEFCPNKKKEFTVTKIDRAGRMVGSLKIPRFHCVRSPYIHFVEAENGELCLSQKCFDDDSYEHISLQTICFDDEDYVRNK